MFNMKDNLKWTKSKIFLIGFNCILCIAIVVSGMMIVIDKSRIKNGAVYTGGKANEETTSDEPSAFSTARLMIAGENTAYNTLTKQAQTDSGYDYSSAYAPLKDILAKANVAMLTQSTVFDTDNEPSAAPNYNAPKELLTALTDVGFNVFNQANDHIIDMGISGIKNNIALFKSTQTTLTGIFETRDEMTQPVLKVENDVIFSFVGITEHLGGYYLSSGSELGVLSLSDTRVSESELYGMMRQVIDSAKKASDFVCVAVHWDSETGSKKQEELINKLLDYGVDIIVGTGVDTLSPIEFKENCDGENAVVVNSVGRLISLQETAESMLSGIVDITVSKDFTSGKTSIISAKIIPTVTVYDKDYGNLRVVPFSECTAEMIENHGLAQEDESFTYSFIEDKFKTLYGDKLELE